MRKRIEKLFGEAKEFMGLRQAKFRRTQFVKEQVLMTAAAQNIKRMIKLLTRPGPKADAVAVSAERTRKRTETMVNQCRSFLATVAGSRFAEIIGYAEC
jgi:hypothetical protein